MVGLWVRSSEMVARRGPTRPRGDENLANQTEIGIWGSATLKSLQSSGHRSFDINPRYKDALARVEPADLLAEHPADVFASQTDLLLLWGGHEPPKE
jgi:hypothetical protein